MREQRFVSSIGGEAERDVTDKEFYRLRKKAGVCVQCGQEDAFTMAGRSRCSRCAEMGAESKRKLRTVEEKKIRMNAQHNDMEQKRRDMGLCPMCGRPATPGYITCEYCRAKKRNWQRNRRNSFHRGENGICWTCNKNKSLPGKHLCQSCYDMTLLNLKNGYETIHEKKVSGYIHPFATRWSFPEARDV